MAKNQLTTLFTLLLFLFLASIIDLTSLVSKMANDPGLGWHLKTGQWILANGMVPKTDPFLYAETPRDWVADQWLSDILLWKIYAAWGWHGLSLLTAAIGLIVCFVILPGVVTASPAATGVVCYLAFKLLSVQMLARPVIIGILFFAVLTLLLRKTRNRGWIPLFFALWANCHPSFVLGLVALVLIEFSAGKKIVLLAIFSLLATFINPYGYNIWKNFFELSSSSYFLSLHQEWKALSLSSSEGEIFIYFLLLVAAGLFQAKSRVKLLPLAMIFTYFAFKHVRMVPQAAIILAPFAMAGFDLLFSRIGRINPLKVFFKRADRPHSVMQVRLTILLAAVIAASGVVFSSDTVGPDRKYYPYSEIEFLKNRGGGVVASISDWGGFLTFYGDGKVKAIIDDRNNLVHENWYKNIENWVEKGQGIETLLKRGVHLILVPRMFTGRPGYPECAVIFRGEMADLLNCSDLPPPSKLHQPRISLIPPD